MGATIAITLLWLAFALSHLLMSSLRLRPWLVARLGARGFQGVYSAIALATFVPMCTIYFRNVHGGPLLWSLPRTRALEWTVEIAMGVAFVLLFASLLTPSPTLMSAAGGQRAAAEPRGVHFLTRHAMFMAFALFGLVHLLPNGFAADVAFFGGFPLFVLVGTMHQDSRKLAQDGARYRAFYDATPLLPFTGRSTLRGLRELSRPAIALGIAATILIRWFHADLFSR